MLHIHRGERADALVAALGGVVVEPLDDPMAAEVVAVPTRGVERWLTQRLSTRLGATPGRADGVCANIAFPYPAALVGGAVRVWDVSAGARPARVASFGGRRIFTAERAATAPRTWDTGEAAYVLHDAGWAGANDAFQSDMDVTDHQIAMIEYENQVRLSFHANSHVGLTERRWYVAGTEGTLIADLKKGQKVSDLANDRHITKDEFAKKLAANLKPRLAQLVDHKQITQAQADRILDRISKGRIPFWDGIHRRK